MTGIADAERTAVYAAELAAFDGLDLETPLDFEVVAARMSAVVNGDWWPGMPVVVRRARVDARSSSTRCVVEPTAGEEAVVRLAQAQLTFATAAHELAHVLAGVEIGHGRVFRRAYLDLIAVITNIDSTDRRRDLHVDQLADAFAAAGLEVGERAWPLPPASQTGAFAL